MPIKPFLGCALILIVSLIPKAALAWTCQCSFGGGTGTAESSSPDDCSCARACRVYLSKCNPRPIVNQPERSPQSEASPPAPLPKPQRPENPPPGYEYKTSDPTDFNVNWIPNSRYPGYPNIHASEKEHTWYADECYTFVNPGTNNLTVRWDPNQRVSDPHVHCSDQFGKVSTDPCYSFIYPGSDDRSVKWDPKGPTPTAPNVHCGGAFTGEDEYIYENDGYEFVNRADPHDLRVRWVAGKLSKTHTNLVSDDQKDVWIPAEGYDWLDRESMTVRWVPNSLSRDGHRIAQQTERSWRLLPGYAGDPWHTYWQPGQHSSTQDHVVAASQERRWSPQDGYSWRESDDRDGHNPSGMVEWTPGLRSSVFPNVVAAIKEGWWEPAPGYGWAIALFQAKWRPILLSQLQPAYELTTAMDRAARAMRRPGEAQTNSECSEFVGRVADSLGARELRHNPKGERTANDMYQYLTGSDSSTPDSTASRRRLPLQGWEELADGPMTSEAAAQLAANKGDLVVAVQYNPGMSVDEHGKLVRNEGHVAIVAPGTPTIKAFWTDWLTGKDTNPSIINANPLVRDGNVHRIGNDSKTEAKLGRKARPGWDKTDFSVFPHSEFGAVPASEVFLSSKPVKYFRWHPQDYDSN